MFFSVNTGIKSMAEAQEVHFFLRLFVLFWGHIVSVDGVWCCDSWPEPRSVK